MFDGKLTLPSDTEILVTRRFTAPRGVVFRAWTTPELLRRWWPGNEGTMSTAEVDLRVGGRWRFGVTPTGGTSEDLFTGEYRQIVSNELLVYTESYAANLGTVAQTTVTFADDRCGTRVEILIRYPDRSGRDEHRRYMVIGLDAAFALLDDVVLSEVSA